MPSTAAPTTTAKSGSVRNHFQLDSTGGSSLSARRSIKGPELGVGAGISDLRDIKELRHGELDLRLGRAHESARERRIDMSEDNKYYQSIAKRILSLLYALNPTAVDCLKDEQYLGKPRN